MRRRRLARLIPDLRIRAAFDRDGFVIKGDFLHAPEFSPTWSIRCAGLRAPAREMVEG
jgi:hypothetical protein